jgi:Family of unknown function (DUF6622)
MTALAAIVTHTPIWVFGVFALLLLLGVQGLRPRRVALARLLVTPAVFVSWGLVSLVLATRVTATAPLAWAVTATAGFAFAYATVRLHGLGAEPGGRVHLPGSVLPLTRNMLIFAAKYVLAAAMAVHPETRGQLVVWDIAVSGASAGYFIGWTVRLLLAYRRAAAPMPARGA